MGTFTLDYSWLFGNHDDNNDGVTDFFEIQDKIISHNIICEENEAERTALIESMKENDEFYDASDLFGNYDMNDDGVTDIFEATEIIDDDDRINDEIEAEKLASLDSYQDDDDFGDIVGNDDTISDHDGDDSQLDPENIDEPPLSGTLNITYGDKPKVVYKAKDCAPAANANFNSPSDYLEIDEFDNKIWHLSKAVIDRYPNLTKKCSDEDCIEDTICEIYSIDKTKGVEAWQWLLDVFYADVIKTSENEDCFDSVFFEVHYFEEKYSEYEENFLTSYFLDNPAFTKQVVASMTNLDNCNTLVSDFVSINNYDWVKYITDTKFVPNDTHSFQSDADFLLIYFIGALESQDYGMDKRFIPLIKSFFPYLKNKDKTKHEQKLNDLIKEGVFDEKHHADESDLEDDEKDEDDKKIAEICAEYQPKIEKLIALIEQGYLYEDGFNDDKSTHKIMFMYPVKKVDVALYYQLLQKGNVERQSEFMWIGTFKADSIQEAEELIFSSTAHWQYSRLIHMPPADMNACERTEVYVNVPLIDCLKKYSNMLNLYILTEDFCNALRYATSGIDIIERAKSITNDYIYNIHNKQMDLYDELKKDGKIFGNSIIEEKLFLFVSYHFPNAIHRYAEGEFADTPLDVYIPDKNVAIECRGISYDQGEKKFGKDWLIRTVESDKKKEHLCKEKGIKLSIWDYSEELTLAHLLEKII